MGYELLKGIEELVADYYPKADMPDRSTGSGELNRVLRGIFYENNHPRKSYKGMYGRFVDIKPGIIVNQTYID